jgi:beta-glucanase (GH16 family)
VAHRRFRREYLLAALVALAASACVPPAVAPAPDTPAQADAPVEPAASATPASPAGLRLVFAEDFSGSRLNRSKWDTCYPWANSSVGCTNFGNNELEWYLPEQAQVSRGALRLVASAQPTAGFTRSGQPLTYPWRSGIVTSYRSFRFTYGYVEIVARVPKGDGFWPALWLLPETWAWPPEIDIQEGYGDDTFSMYPNFHSTTTGQHQGSAHFATDMSTAFHTYALDWQPGSLDWYVDGQVVHTYRGADVPSEPMYFLANLAISGNYPPTAATPASASFDIDRIRVYQR